MENLITIFGGNLVAVISMMICGWLVSLIYKNVSIVDSLWGLGFVLIAWLTFGQSGGFTGRKILIVLITTAWGLRLSAHMSWRNWRKGEDPRYGGWRKTAGDRFWIISLFKVFFVLGSIIWMIGFVFESVSDWQLARFKADQTNAGKVMDRGLWAYSRHPNYFGECLIWWGIFLVALSTPNSWWTVVSPIVITAVLLKMTGIPLTEKTIINTRPGYRDYIKRTPSFFPWFPQKD
jgi:steroid 5-alpha reductase family enzyme